MRITDLVVGVMLNYPYSRYDTLTLATFDLVIAVLAIWLRAKLVNSAVSSRLITSLCGLLVTFSAARVVVGVMLAGRFPPGGNQYSHPVYGNDLAQQITSTFSVALCGLAVGILVAARISAQLSGRRRRPVSQPEPPPQACHRPPARYRNWPALALARPGSSVATTPPRAKYPCNRPPRGPRPRSTGRKTRAKTG
jgi:hypothetical protein